MNDRLKALQRWINIVGAPAGIKIAEDGLKGPATRAAIIDVFANKQAPAVTKADVARFAALLGGTARQVLAVAMTESNGGGFLDTGQPKILWERHYAAKRIKGEIPALADFTPGGYSLDADRDGINDSWEHLADFAMLYPQHAFECASWGKFQVMGAWYDELDYPTSLDFAWSMTQSEAAHYEALVRYIVKFGLTGAFRSISADPADCLAFARGYNGKGQKGYDAKIAANFAKLG